MNSLYAVCPKCYKVNEFVVSDEELEGNCWYSCTYCEGETQLLNYEQINDTTYKILKEVEKNPEHYEVNFTNLESMK